MLRHTRHHTIQVRFMRGACSAPCRSHVVAYDAAPNETALCRRHSGATVISCHFDERPAKRAWNAACRQPPYSPLLPFSRQLCGMLTPLLVCNICFTRVFVHLFVLLFDILLRYEPHYAYMPASRALLERSRRWRDECLSARATVVLKSPAAPSSLFHVFSLPYTPPFVRDAACFRWFIITPLSPPCCHHYFHATAAASYCLASGASSSISVRALASRYFAWRRWLAEQTFFAPATTPPSPVMKKRERQLRQLWRDSAREFA